MENAKVEKIEYANWISVDRTTMLNISATVDEFVQRFMDNLLKLKVHSFLTKKQGDFLKYKKENLKPTEVLMMFDFSMSLTYVVQNAEQAFFFNNSQCTVFPLIFYFKEKGVKKHESFVFLSDCTKHDSAFVYAVLTKIIPKIKARMKSVEKIVYFTDRAKQHFKNRYQIDLLRHHEEDFGLQAEWHFNTTAHGRSEYDGIGGKLKQETYTHCLKADPKNAILTFQKLVIWAKGHFKNIQIEHFDKVYHETITKRLQRRYSLAPAINGISKNHSFVFEKNNLVMKKYSTDERSIIL